MPRWACASGRIWVWTWAYRGGVMRTPAAARPARAATAAVAKQPRGAPSPVSKYLDGSPFLLKSDLRSCDHDKMFSKQTSVTYVKVVPEETCSVLKVFLENMNPKAISCMEHHNSKTDTAMDMGYMLKSHSCTILQLQQLNSITVLYSVAPAHLQKAHLKANRPTNKPTIQTKERQLVIQ
ncbi:hypothetical protein J0S82_015437 [Galemys pyrenaicus]|uniref:Uncharacterized protein n=1 Tax=Galemys pyrenaicus TaxID=202257 RepID=A0A8J6AKF1_GALPY|nr:hypothetical protein J0S82_015437 [Galemys pyrenaicus]